MSLLQIPATSSTCVFQTWDFQYSTLISPQIRTSSQSLGFRIPSPKEHGNPESGPTLALLLLPLIVTEFSGFPLDTSSEGLPPNPTLSLPPPLSSPTFSHGLQQQLAFRLPPASSSNPFYVYCCLVDLTQMLKSFQLLPTGFSCIPSLQYVKSRPKTQASCFVKEPAVPF